MAERRAKHLFGEAAFRRLKEYAASRDGVCLDRVYRTSWTPMRFRCARGHVWRDRPIRLTTDGKWCQLCRAEDRLERLRELARANGGECLSRSYRGARAKYRLRCAKGHVWKTTAIMITGGHWCPTCRLTGRPPAYSIEDVREAADALGGRLLSRSYRRVHQRLAFECAAGHRFEKRVGRLLDEQSWCRRCVNDAQRAGIGAAITIAKRRGGRCLSQSYVNGTQHLEWECREGHRWRAGLKNVRKGTWCPFCNRPRRLTLEDMHAVARARGGQCVSKRFRNTTTHLWWECADGHQWRATPKNVRQHGTWCPDCARGLPAEEVQRRRKAFLRVARMADRFLDARKEQGRKT